MSVFVSKNIINKSDNCIICFENITDCDILNNNFYLECNQCMKTFHTECIDKWDELRNNCPHCRYTINHPEIIFYYPIFLNDQFIIYSKFLSAYIIIYGLLRTFILLVFLNLIILYIFYTL